MKFILNCLIITAICLPIATNAADTHEKIKVEAPDMEKIKQEVTDRKSKYYYPKLMEGYEQNETIMGLDEYRYLYFGYLFQEDFNPYRHSDYSKKYEDQYYKDTHTRAECDTIIKYAELSLKDNPFDLRQITFLIYAYREKKKNNIANIWQYRLNHILEAIASTGSGTTQENAWYVINPQHEYDLLNTLGYVAENQSFVEPYYDYITVKAKNEKSPQGFYFNIKNMLDEYFRKFPDE